MVSKKTFLNVLAFILAFYLWIIADIMVAKNRIDRYIESGKTHPTITTRISYSGKYTVISAKGWFFFRYNKRVLR